MMPTCLWIRFTYAKGRLGGSVGWATELRSWSRGLWVRALHQAQSHKFRKPILTLKALHLFHYFSKTIPHIIECLHTLSFKMCSLVHQVWIKVDTWRRLFWREWLLMVCEVMSLWKIISIFLVYFLLFLFLKILFKSKSVNDEVLGGNSGVHGVWSRWPRKNSWRRLWYWFY